MARLSIELPADLGGEDRVPAESGDRLADQGRIDVDAREPDRERAEPPLIQRWARCWAGA